MPADERDSQFERALARHLSHAPGEVSCPDAETLAAYYERSLSVEETARWKEHIAACVRCQEALSLVEQTENVQTTEEQNQRELEGVAQLATQTTTQGRDSAPQTPADYVTPGRASSPASLRRLRPRAAWSWIVPLGAVAAGAIVVVGVHEIHSQRAKETQIALQRLPAPLPAPLESTAKEAVRKEEAPVARSQNAVNAPKSIAPSSNASPTQSLSPAGPPASKELSQSARQESPHAKTRPSVSLEPPPSVSSYAASADALQTNAPPAPSAVPATPGAATPSAAAQQDQENKKAQAKVGEIQRNAAATGMTQAEMVAVPTDNLLVQTALNNRRYIVAPGEKHAWRLGDGGLIEVSTDRGKTWKPQSSGVGQDLTAGSATSDKVCWVVGKSGTLLLTTDGGKHWNRIAAPITSDFGGVHATDASHASIWDVSNRTSFETNDGGVTWQRIANE